MLQFLFLDFRFPSLKYLNPSYFHPSAKQLACDFLQQAHSFISSILEYHLKHYY